MKTTVSKLRQNIFRFLDTVIKTGKPIEIERKGEKLKIVHAKKGSKFSRLVRRNATTGQDPQSLVHLDWSSEWEGKKDL